MYETKGRLGNYYKAVKFYMMVRYMFVMHVPIRSLISLASGNSIPSSVTDALIKLIDVLLAVISKTFRNQESPANARL